MKRIKPLLLACSLLAPPAFAEYNTSANQAQLDLHFAASSSGDGVYYTPRYKDIDLFGARISGLDSCDGNIGLTITNAFTDGTIKRIYENFSSILKSFDGSSGAIYLSSLYIQKSNPGLYQLLDSGIGASLQDFLSGKASCEAMASAAVSMVPDSVLETHKASKINDIIERNSSKFNKDWSNVDITKYVKEGANAAINKGIEWFDGQKGGENQQAIDMVRDTVKYGYCIYRGVSKTKCNQVKTLEDVEKNVAADKADAAKQSDQIMEQILLGNGVNSLQEASVMILGNEYLSICEGCETITVKGAGIRAYITKTQEDVYNGIIDLAKKPINSLTEKELLKVSAKPPTLTPDYFRAFALLENNWDVRNRYINGVAYDVAFQRSFALMGRIHDSLVAVRSTDEIKKGGLTGNVDRLIERLDKEKERLQIDAKVKNYRPMMYSEDTLKLLNNKSLVKSLL